MKKLKLDFGDLQGAELLTKEQLKTIQGGVLSGGGGCAYVYSDQQVSSCWYTYNPSDLCHRVYGTHCAGYTSVECNPDCILN